MFHAIPASIAVAPMLSQDLITDRIGLHLSGSESFYNVKVCDNKRQDTPGSEEDRCVDQSWSHWLTNTIYGSCSLPTSPAPRPVLRRAQPAKHMERRNNSNSKARRSDQAEQQQHTGSLFWRRPAVQQGLLLLLHKLDAPHKARQHDEN